MENFDPKTHYKCDSCGEVFEKGWSDEEAEKEADDLFPGLKVEDRAVVCDDCFKRMTGDHP